MAVERASPRSRLRLREPPAALSSDAWYTLVYLTPAARRQLAERRRRIWSAPLLSAGLSRSETLRALREHARWKEEREAVGTTPPLGIQAQRWLARSGVRADAESIVAELDRALLRAPVRVARGALPALRGFVRAGVPLALVSNVANETGEAARQILDRTGLLAHFGAVYLSCDHRRSKPSPEPFRAVASFLEVPVSRLLHVGDLAYDLDGPARAGARALLFTGFARWNRYLRGAVTARARRGIRTARSWEEVAATWKKLTRSP